MKLTQRLQGLALRQQLRWALALVTLVALLIAGGVMLGQVRKQEAAALSEQVSALGRLVASRSAAAMAFGDERAALENLQALETLDFIAQACLLDRQGRVVARYARKQEAGAPAADCQAGQAQRSAVMVGGEAVGELLLSASADAVAKRIAPWQRGLALALVLALVTALLVAEPLQRLVSRPMESLRGLAQRIDESGNFSLRAPVLGQGEMGRLAAAFNRMLETIATQNGALASREHYARTLFSTSQRAQLVLARQDGHILDANIAAARLLGVARPEALHGRRLDEFMRAPAEAISELLMQLMPEAPVERLWSLQRGSIGWEARADLLRLDLLGEDQVFVSLDDITQRLADERAILNANTELEQRVEERTRDLAETIDRLNATRDQLVGAEKQAALARLVAGMAHEINTPIGNARLAVSVIGEAQRGFAGAMGGSIRRADLQRFLDQVRESQSLADRNLLRVIELVGTLKQMSADQANSQRRRFDLQCLIQDVMQLLGPQLRRGGCNLQFDLAPGIAMHSHAGPLEQVLVNLVQNALMHGLEGRAQGNIRISSRLSADGQQAEVCVEDDGLGMSAEVLAQVFDPFFTTKMGRGGLGLGLSIVQGLVQNLLGGRLQLRSTPGVGTQAWIWMPLNAPDH